MLDFGGRLSNADISYTQKYPILLPSNNHIVTLLLRRKQFCPWNIDWIVWDGLRFIKCACYSHYCLLSDNKSWVICLRDRVSVNRPFLKTRVNFEGAFNNKTLKLKRSPLTRRYIPIFICVASKCVHIDLDLVSSLSKVHWKFIKS